MHSGFTMLICLNCRISAYFWILALAACKPFSRKFRRKSSKIEKMGSRRPRKRREVENRDLSDLVLNSRHFGIWRQKSPKIGKISCRTAVEAFWGYPQKSSFWRPRGSPGNLRTTSEHGRPNPATSVQLPNEAEYCRTPFWLSAHPGLPDAPACPGAPQRTPGPNSPKRLHQTPKFWKK